MASSGVAQPGLYEAGRDHLQCFICNDYFREPRCLACLHKFCLKCLQELCNHQTAAGSEVICPLCSKETQAKDVADLPQCHTLSALVDEFRMQKLLLEGQGSEIACQACVEKSQAVSRCADCGKFLCEACRKAHQRLTLMKSHKICSLDQFTSGKVVYRSQLRDRITECEKHPAENASIFCNNCEQLICSTCLVRAHAQHSFSGADEALEDCKQDLKGLIAAVEKSKGGMYAAVAKTGTSLKKLQSKFADTNRRISQRAREEVAKIREKEQELRHDLDKVYLDRYKIFETAQASVHQDARLLERMLQEAKQLTGQDGGYEILHLKKMLFPNLKELIQTCQQPMEFSDRMYLMDFEGDQSFGNLVFEDDNRIEPEAVQVVARHVESRNAALRQKLSQLSQAKEVAKEIPDKQPKSTKKRKKKKTPNNSDLGSFESLAEDKPKSASDSETEATRDSETPKRADSFEHWLYTKHIKTIGSDQKAFGCAFDVAVFSDNEMVIVDTELKRLIRYSLTSDPRHQSDQDSSILEIQGLTDPSRVSVDKDDRLVALDNHTSTVNIFSRKYKRLRQFIPGRGTNKMATCLAVDECNQIAVGFKQEKQIFLHGSEGSFIRAVHATMIDFQLTTYRQRFVYTNYWNRTLYAQKYSGDMVFSVNVPSNSDGHNGPNSLCCDRSGNIYVAVRACGSTIPPNEVIRFSPDGTNLGLVITGCGLPRGITLTPDGDHLIVATQTSVSIFRRVILSQVPPQIYQ